MGTYSSKLRSFLCPHFWAKCFMLVTYQYLTFGIIVECILTTWVIKWFLKLHTYVFYRFFFKIQKHDFLRFIELLNTFSRTLILSKTVPSRGGYRPPSNNGSLDPQQSVPQTASRSVQPFLHSSPVCPTQTDTQTTLRAISVAKSRIPRTACRRCGLLNARMTYMSLCPAAAISNGVCNTHTQNNRQTSAK